MSTNESNLLVFKPDNVPLNAPRDILSINLHDPKYGGRSMTWQSEPGKYRMGPNLLTVYYDEVDRETFLAECVNAKATLSTSTLNGLFCWARTIAFTSAPYLEDNGEYVEVPSEETSGGYPSNLFLQLLVESERGDVYKGGKFYRLREINRWDQDIYGSLGASELISVAEGLIEHEEKLTLGRLRPL